MEQKYESKTLLFKEIGKMTKPTMQRGFKWSMAKQIELINSIRNGLPFGTFLLEEKRGGYSILDGQQRYTTIRNYKDDMTPFLSNEDILVEELIKKIEEHAELKRMIKKCKGKIEKIPFKKIFKNNKANEKNTMREIEDEVLKIIDDEEIKETKNSRKLQDCITEWIKETLKPIDIDNVKIPAIILTDKIDDKADIFIKLNQGGLKLSKYELLAAQWSDKDSKLCCDDNEILEKIISRYKNINNKEIEYDSFDEDEIKNFSNGNKNINAYEYLYGLSELINDKIKEITNVKKSNETAYGFILVSEIFNKASKDMNGVNKCLVKFGDLTKLKEKVIESVEAVYSKLTKEFKAPDDHVYLDHTENQIASFIVVYFKTKYEIKDNKIIELKNKSNKRNIENLIDFMIQHYIYDNISDTWVGSGDKKLHDLVKDETLNNCRYYQSVDENLFKNQIVAWFKSKNNDDAKSVKSDTKMILTFILNKTAKGLGNNIKESLQWEHIGIKSKLKDYKIRAGVSSPSNITLIPALDNMQKQKLTYYEYEKQFNKKSLLKLDKVSLKKLLYPEHAEIRWVEGTKDITKEEFEKFKINRTEMLIDLIINKLFK